jgi:hypothetical protein
VRNGRGCSRAIVRPASAQFDLFLFQVGCRQRCFSGRLPGILDKNHMCGGLHVQLDVAGSPVKRVPIIVGRYRFVCYSTRQGTTDRKLFSFRDSLGGCFGCLLLFAAHLNWVRKSRQTLLITNLFVCRHAGGEMRNCALCMTTC